MARYAAITIQVNAMKFPRWDRIYYFVYFALFFALASLAGLFVIPLVEVTDIATGDVYVTTISADAQWDIVWLSLIPVFISGSALWAVPKYEKPDNVAKINIWVSTFLLYVFIAMMIFVNGILFIPSAMFMTAAAVGSQVTRRERTIFAKTASETKSGKGVSKRRRNRG